MKKSLIFSMFAATMLLATSCQQDEVFVDNSGAVVTFEISTPEIATRAFSDGATATQLQYAVYDADLKLVDREGLKGTEQFNNKKANIQMDLAAGKTYNVLFWAAAPDAPYTIDYDKLVMSVSYEGAVSNAENRDAFYCFKNITVKQGNESVKVILTRPFAQLNIGTDDLEKLDGVSAQNTQVAVPVYSTLDLVNGTATGNVETETFAFAGRPQGETFPVADYEYLAMNYLLVGNDKTVVDVEFSYGTAESNNTRTFTSIPVKANYRTNIYGSLLTQGVDFNVEIDNNFSNDPENPYNNNYGSYAIASKADLKEALNSALANNENTVVLDATHQNIGDLNYGLTQALVPAGTTVTIKNATIEGKSYGNGANGDVIFENCIFTNTGAYSIHFDNGNGNVTFKDCALYGWNSFGSSLTSVSFYDSSLYGNGTYAIIRSYVPLYMENCYINTKDANHTDVYNEGVEQTDGEPTLVNCYFADDTEAFAEAIMAGGDIELTEDLAVSTGSFIHTVGLTQDLTIDGKGNTIVSVAESIDDFQWAGGTIPNMSTMFTSDNGSKVTVSNLSFAGTMSALMLGHYQSSTYNNYNTELNNVNVINTEVVSFSANTAPAVCVYGTATLNNCNIYGTTLSELDTDPMWPVYDLVAVNYTKTTLNDCKIGSFYIWNQAEAVIAAGTTVESLIVRGNMNTTKYGVTIKAGATVGAIDLSAITNKAKINFTIEDGATVGKIVANGVEYANLDAWKNA